MSNKPRVFVSSLTGRAYFTNDYKPRGVNDLVANTRHDVTEDVVYDLMASAWARGWTERHIAAAGSEAPPNPYRPRGRTHTATQARGAVVKERDRCICSDICINNCRACNYSGRDLEEMCIADPEWEPDDGDLERREALNRDTTPATGVAQAAPKETR